MPFEQLCEVTGDRLGQDSRYWLDSSRDQARRRLGAADRLGGRPGRNGRLGAQISAGAQEPLDRIRAAGLTIAARSAPRRPSGTLLGPAAPLRPDHAVAALLQLSDGRYVMQLRDVQAGDLLSGALGLFRRRGRCRRAPPDAILRELAEELGRRRCRPARVPCISPSSPSISASSATASIVGATMPCSSRAGTTLPGFMLGEGAGSAPSSAERRCSPNCGWCLMTLSRYGCIISASGLRRLRLGPCGISPCKGVRKEARL